MSGKRKVISVHLSDEGIDAAIKEIKAYKRYLVGHMQRLITAMCKEGESYAIAHVGHYDTGATEQSIHGYRSGNKGVIVAGGNAVWIEFGTGVYWNGFPNSSPHPRGAMNGMIIGEYGKQHGLQQGWFFPTTDPRYEIVKQNADGTETHTGYGYTHGIQATMFMWNTAKELQRKFPELARQVFG